MYVISETILGRDDIEQEVALELLKSYRITESGALDLQPSTVLYRNTATRLHLLRGQHARGVGVATKPKRQSDIIQATNNQRVDSGGPLMKDSEIAELFGIPVRGDERVGVNDLLRILMLTRFMGSLGSGFSPSQSISPGNRYENEASGRESLTAGPPVSTEDGALGTLRPAAVQDFLNSSNLTEDEMRVTKLRYGFTGEPKDLVEISKEMGIHRSTANNIAARALRKLRHAPNIEDILNLR